MNAIDKQAVPLGGSRVPESMGGGASAQWWLLPEASQTTQEKNFGETYDAVLALREKAGAYKKKLCALAPPMKECLFNAGGCLPRTARVQLCLSPSLRSFALLCICLPTSSPLLKPRWRFAALASLCDSDAAENAAALEAALSEAAAAAESIRAAAAFGGEKLKAEFSEESAVRKAAEAALEESIQEASALEAEVGALCTATLAKAKKETAGETETALSPKEIYGDFNLALGVHTRKCFARQQKLLAVLKQIKASSAAPDNAPAGEALQES